jgi:undecaprenyl-diphosphatase
MAYAWRALLCAGKEEQGNKAVRLKAPGMQPAQHAPLYAVFIQKSRKICLCSQGIAVTETCPAVHRGIVMFFRLDYTPFMRQSFTHSLRSYAWRHQLLCLLPSLLLLCCLAGGVGLGNEVTLYFKEFATQHPLTTNIMRFLTNWANKVMYAVYAALFVYALRVKKKDLLRFVLTFVLVQIAVSAILVQTTKIIVGRPRPLPALEGFAWSPFSGKGMFHSFPSGHTSEIAGAVFPLVNRYASSLLSLSLGILVAGVGFSRIYLSMHHISDVAGGLLVGLLAGLLTHHFCNRGQS